MASRVPDTKAHAQQESPVVGNPAGPEISDVVDPLWRRVLNDRFTILDPIGSGGMGKVYKAVQAPLDRVVALKVLNPNYANGKDPEFRKRFFLEASLTSRLRHPNTITVIDYGQTPDGIFYIAMEYLEGQTLSQLLAKSGPLRWTRCLNIAQQICRSLREAHKMGVIHRDLKPANVMLLSEDQEMDMVKVLDFGLVKSFLSEEERRASHEYLADPAANGNNPEVTHGGMFLGSPQYMAPEQARNRADHRSDIYSLGATVYHMLAGRPPFWAKDAIEVIFKHINEPVPPLRSVRPDLDIPAEVEAVLMKCLEKQPSHRFQSMDEVLEAIRRASMATGNSGIFVEAATTPHTGTANTPPPMPALSIPPPTPQQAFNTETTLALDISVVPSPEPSPSAPWYRKRTWLLSAAGVSLLLLVGFSFALGRRGSNLQAAREIQAVAKPAPPVEKAVVVEPTEKTSLGSTERAEPVSKTVKFRVSSEPSGATVSAGGHVLGVTPLSFDVPGNSDGTATAQLLFVMKGYHPMTVITGGSREVVLTQKMQARPIGRSGGGTSEPREAVDEKPAITVAVPEVKKSEIDTKMALAKLTPTGEQPKPIMTVAAEISPPDVVRSEPPIGGVTNATAGPSEFNENMTAPVKVSGPDPEYTQKALDHEVEGLMMVRCIVTIQGLVHGCRALKSVPFMERPVIDALERRRYQPAFFQGKPVEVYYTFKLTLKLPR